VAAVSCSTPTHAAETAVRVHCGEARTALLAHAHRLRGCGHRAVIERARRLSDLTRAPAEHVARQRALLHQKLRELRAAGRRGVDERRGASGSQLTTLSRRADALGLRYGRAAAAVPAGAADLQRVCTSALARRARELERLTLALSAHDPDRTLKRGYALVADADGEMVTSAAKAREAGKVSMRFHDDSVHARVEEETR